MTLYTIGHSTRTFEQFLGILRRYDIRCVVDVRRFPSSRKFPQFNRGELERSLAGNDIRYIWIEKLGGRRHEPTDARSPNIGLRSPAFRNYADYMQSEEFRKALDEVIAVAKSCPTAIVCAEKLYFRCHRMLISDYMLTLGIDVLHIGISESAEADKPVHHVYTSCARLENGKLTYPAPVLPACG